MEIKQVYIPTAAEWQGFTNAAPAPQTPNNVGDSTTGNSSAVWLWIVVLVVVLVVVIVATLPDNSKSRASDEKKTNFHLPKTYP